ncbi:hypothetical protein LXL04_022455 [Taraxacum kok-saghyz]
MADRHRTDRSFEVGSSVFLKVQPYCQKTVRAFHQGKLSPKYYDPFLIVEKIGPVAYRLDLPSNVLIHHTFHVSLLKQAAGPPTTVIPLPTDSHFLLQPHSILDRKMVERSNRAAVKFLVHWRNTPLSNATWDLADEFTLPCGSNFSSIIPSSFEDAFLLLKEIFMSIIKTVIKTVIKLVQSV